MFAQIFPRNPQDVQEQFAVTAQCLNVYLILDWDRGYPRWPAMWGYVVPTVMHLNRDHVIRASI